VTTVPDPLHRHPLDPLDAGEIRAAVAILRRTGRGGRGWRIASVELREPVKDVVRAFGPGDPVVREANIVAWERGSGVTGKAVVALEGGGGNGDRDRESDGGGGGGAVVSWTEYPGEQANATLDEFHEVAGMVTDHPGVAAALAGRGVTDMASVLVDTWTFGRHVIPPAYVDRRVGWCDLWRRDVPGGNPYAHLISGLKVIVDLDRMEVLEIEDHGGPADAPVMAEYRPGLIPGRVGRDDLRPLEISQPEGTSFTLDGHGLAWQGWDLRVGFNHREGLVLHGLAFTEHGSTRRRPVAYRLSLAEMIVPYRDPSPDHARRTAYDIGEWGLGFMTTSLALGCDCLGAISYLDAVLHDTTGEPYTIDNAICIHEEDNAVLWKHVDPHAGAEVRRMRRLVVSCHVTVANYEYLVYWRLYQDGAIECEIRATGVMVTTPFDGDAPPTGTVVDTRTYAPIHQHFIVARLDMEVDGPANTVVATETVAPPAGPDNPHGLALVTRSTPLLTEAEGRQDPDWASQRAWSVTNPGSRNRHGAPVAYKLVPSASIPALIDESSPVFQRAQVIGHTLWVTPFDREERWPCGEFVNQSGVDTGLPAWTAADRPIDDTDLVVWYVAGIHHVPRPEDWPVMPADTVAFWLKPWGFFDRNPTLDLDG
jgi:primary-amine oxidase